MQVEFAADPVEPVAEAGHGLLPRAVPSSRPQQCASAKGVVTRTTTQTGAKRFKLLPRRQGQQPVASSVSGTAGRARRPARSGRKWLVSWQEAGPLVTVVVRCDPVVCGPDVAPMWPQRSRAWKARPSTPLSRDAVPMAQFSAPADRPLLSVADRQGPMRTRGEHGRRGPGWFGRGGDGDHLNPRVRPVPGDHLPRWQAPGGRAAGLSAATSPSP
jgi:hypothetical protein